MQDQRTAVAEHPPFLLPCRRDVRHVGHASSRARATMAIMWHRDLTGWNRIVDASPWGRWRTMTLERCRSGRPRLTAWGFIDDHAPASRTHATSELRTEYERWLDGLSPDEREEVELFRLARVPSPKRLRLIIEAHERGDDTHVRALLRDQ